MALRQAQYKIGEATVKHETTLIYIRIYARSASAV